MSVVILWLPWLLFRSAVRGLAVHYGVDAAFTLFMRHERGSHVVGRVPVGLPHGAGAISGAAVADAGP